MPIPEKVIMTDPQRIRFEKLYKSHVQLVRNILFNMVDPGSLDDLTQEAFVRIWNGLPKFNFLSSEKTWIYRITVNTAIDFLRKKKIATSEYTNNLKNYSSEIKNEFRQNDRQILIQAALQKLDPEHRAVIILYYFEELEINTIARTLEVPIGTVKSRLFNARQNLKKIFEPEGGHIAILQA